MKIAIVTGGSNGIGKAAAIELGRRGIGVILTYNAAKKGAEEVVREIEKGGTVRAVALKLDLSQGSTFKDFTQGLMLFVPKYRQLCRNIGTGYFDKNDTQRVFL